MIDIIKIFKNSHPVNSVLGVLIIITASVWTLDTPYISNMVFHYIFKEPNPTILTVQGPEDIDLVIGKKEYPSNIDIKVSYKAEYRPAQRKYTSKFKFYLLLMKNHAVIKQISTHRTFEKDYETSPRYANEKLSLQINEKLPMSTRESVKITIKMPKNWLKDMQAFDGHYNLEIKRTFDLKKYIWVQIKQRLKSNP